VYPSLSTSVGPPVGASNIAASADAIAEISDTATIPTLLLLPKINDLPKLCAMFRSRNLAKPTTPKFGSEGMGAIYLDHD
jgi:hypothetical protein